MTEPITVETTTDFGAFWTHIGDRTVVFLLNARGEIRKDAGYYIIGGTYELSRDEGLQLALQAEAELNRRGLIQ